MTIRHLFDLDTNDPTTAFCGSTDGLVRMDLGNVNCPTCLEWAAERTECEGHESLAGEHMGEDVFCDGSCRPPIYSRTAFDSHDGFPYPN